MCLQPPGPRRLAPSARSLPTLMPGSPVLREYGPQVKAGTKMTMTEFVRNCRGINDDQDYNPQLLEELYINIQQQSLRVASRLCCGGIPAQQLQTAILATVPSMHLRQQHAAAAQAAATCMMQPPVHLLSWGPCACMSLVVQQLSYPALLLSCALTVQPVICRRKLRWKPPKQRSSCCCGLF